MDSPPNIEVASFVDILLHYMSWINKAACSQMFFFFPMLL